MAPMMEPSVIPIIVPICLPFSFEKGSFVFVGDGCEVSVLVGGAVGSSVLVGLSLSLEVKDVVVGDVGEEVVGTVLSLVVEDSSVGRLLKIVCVVVAAVDEGFADVGLGEECGSELGNSVAVVLGLTVRVVVEIITEVSVGTLEGGAKAS
jgi:hypothetical protein